MTELEKEKKGNHFLYYFFALAILFLAVLFYIEQKNQPNIKNNNLQNIAEKQAFLVIDYGNKKQRVFTGEVIEGMTIFDVLTTASLAGKFNFKANSHLTAIDNLSNNEKSKWICYLNDQEINEPLNKIFIHPKDRIFCQYR